jgi:hypothetical protein
MPEAPRLKMADMERFQQSADAMAQRFAALNPAFKPVKLAKK